MLYLQPSICEGGDIYVGTVINPLSPTAHMYVTLVHRSFTIIHKSQICCLKYARHLVPKGLTLPDLIIFFSYHAPYCTNFSALKEMNPSGRTPRLTNILPYVLPKGRLDFNG